MNRTVRPVLSTAALLALVLLGGCRPMESGSPGPVSNPVTSSSSTSSKACEGQSYHGDPWIAFEPALRSKATLKVGQRGWISGPQKVADLTVTGDVDAVGLSSQSAVTEMRCGTAAGRRYWVEVRAAKPGTVTFSWVIPDADKKIVLTITE